MGKMRHCIICEGLLPIHSFTEDSIVCKSCVTRQYTEHEIDYSTPARKTPKEAMVNLILAIKEQAERDEVRGFASKEDKVFGGPLASWERNWVQASPWCRIWRILKDLEDNKKLRMKLRRRL